MAVVSRQENHLTTKQHQIYKCSLPDIFGLRKFWEKKYSLPDMIFGLRKILAKKHPQTTKIKSLLNQIFEPWCYERIIISQPIHQVHCRYWISSNFHCLFSLSTHPHNVLLRHKHSADVGIHAGYSLSLSLKSSMMVTRPPIWLTIQTQEGPIQDPKGSQELPMFLRSAFIHLSFQFLVVVVEVNKN